MNIVQTAGSRAWLSPIMLCVALVLTACEAGSGDGLNANGQPLDDEAPPAQNKNDLFLQVQAVFDARCTVCHSGASASQGLVLSAGQAFSQLVGVPSAQQDDLLRVAPGEPDNSYLLMKVRGDAGITGLQMPRNGPPFLSSIQIETIEQWISAGAPPAQVTAPPTEFNAQLSDFTDYPDWGVIDYSIGSTNTALAGLHSSDSEHFARRVYANEKALGATGDEFPVGSILVKEVFSFEGGSKTFAQEGGLLAMVKRGADFNPDHGDWEWFMLASDASSIMARGADLMNGGCNACHQQAALDEPSLTGGMDYVFSHQSEFVAQSSSFENYQTWPLIDDRNDANPRLDGMAHGADIPGSSRRVYKKQLYANPDTVAQGYPIGTILVKEVINDGEIVEVTAMVKRGSDFNDGHGHWEWFMLMPGTGEIMADDNGNLKRGADLMEGMCNGCHFAANTTSGEGIDFVFKHSGDPFNNNQEFFAELSAFADYQQWSLVDYSIGASNPALGGGHQGLNDAFTRKVYANNTALNFEGTTYAKGSIFVKEVTTLEDGSATFPPQLGLVAMAKRGGNFNSTYSGWEWFELEPDLSQIIGRGGEYRNNGCNSCHALANSGNAGADYVFMHPSEFVAQNSDFENYNGWMLIDERNDANPLLGEMAHGAAEQGAVRRVYKKQPYAKAIGNNPGYPVGTILVKETSLNDAVIEITAMAKRKESTESISGWEWFMLDPQEMTIAEKDNGEAMRGFDLMEGMCAGCHALAHDPAEGGQDFVFPHVDDPFYSAIQ